MTKKVIGLLMTAILLVTLFTFCTDDLDVDTNETDNIISAVNQDILSDHLISTNKALSMQSNFLRNQYADITNANELQTQRYVETKYVWWSVEVLEEYLSYLKELEKAHSMDIDGVRFYFGSYNEGLETSDVGLTKKFKNRMGIFTVPTIPSETINNEYEVMNHNGIYISEQGKVKVLQANTGFKNVDVRSSGNSIYMNGFPFPPPPPAGGNG